MKNRTLFNQWRFIKNHIFFTVIIALSLVCFAPLALILTFVVSKGFQALSWSFITNLPVPVGETGGGIINAITGTIMLIAMASAIAIPLGILIGTYLNEYKSSRISGAARLANDILQGTPSIVIGLLVYAWFVKPLGGFSAWSGSVALALMMLPVIVRATEEALKLLPVTLKEASLAVGATYTQTLIKIVLPAAVPGIIGGVLLSVARVAGETAPLLFTAFGNPFINFDPTKPTQSLPLTIFQYAISPYEEWHQLAWAGALVLLIMILSLNILAKWISSKAKTLN